MLHGRRRETRSSHRKPTKWNVVNIERTPSRSYERQTSQANTRTKKKRQKFVTTTGNYRAAASLVVFCVCASCTMCGKLIVWSCGMHSRSQSVAEEQERMYTTRWVRYESQVSINRLLKRAECCSAQRSLSAILCVCVCARYLGHESAFACLTIVLCGCEEIFAVIRFFFSCRSPSFSS